MYRNYGPKDYEKLINELNIERKARKDMERTVASSEGGTTLAPVDARSIELMMEEMAGMSEEELGRRQPGERGMYEIQNLENAHLRVDGVHKDMYRVIYPDGALSDDFYNLTHAKDHVKTIYKTK